MENLKIYLSGGMTDLTFEEQLEWRTSIISKIDEKIILGGSIRKPEFFNPPMYYNFENKEYKTQKEIMDYELFKLRKCDIVIVNFNAPGSIGTAMELAIAKEYHKPVIAIDSEEKIIHPWLIESCTRICDSINECIEHIYEFYLN